MNDASAWGEQGDQKTSVVRAALLAVEPRRHGEASHRCVLILLTEKRQMYVRHPVRRRVCRQPESCASLRGAVVVAGTGLVA